MKAIETFGDEILVRGKARLWLKAPDAVSLEAVPKERGVLTHQKIYGIYGGCFNLTLI